MKNIKRIIPNTIIVVFAVGLMLVLIETATANSVNVIYVDTFIDELNDDGDCSLREAIEAANDDQAVDNCPPGNPSSADDIFLDSGTYFLSQGDINILSSLNIFGMDMDSTIIDGDNSSRIFELLTNGIEVSFSDVTIQNGSTITNTGGGGGILIHPGVALQLNNCKILNNQTDSLGGGLDNWSGMVEVTNCSILSNSAENGGGIYNDGIMIIQNSIIDSNSAEVLGGGLYNSSPGVGKATLENVTISRNSSISDFDGTGIFSNSTITMTNTTIVHNIGSGAGFSSLGKGFLINTIVAEHGDSDNCNGDETEIKSLGYNLEDGDTCNFDQVAKHDLINTDPLLAGDTPQNNGGSTSTYALTSTSLAIDTGTNEGCPATDQRGLARPKDGDKDGNAICDIGAFEFDPMTILYFPLIFK